MAKLLYLEKLRRVPPVYRPVAFWFLNHFLREDELRRQIRAMASKGFGGFIFHARDGLRSGYLNGEWRKALDWCLNEAQKQKMNVWLYDELNYPTGPAGGRMFDYLPDSRMKSLALVKLSIIKPGKTAVFNLDAHKVKYALVITHAGVVKKLAVKGKLRWFNHTGKKATVMALAEETGMAEGYKFPDPLDPEATRRFVDLSYEWYAREFGGFFGTVIKGEFTDNSCCNFGLARRAIPWNDELPERFYRKTGRDLLRMLPSLFTRAADYRENRLLFWKFIGDQYLENFVIPIDRACRKNRILSTGHYCLEMAGSEHIRQLGDRFDQKRHQGLPAVDMLGVDDINKMKDLLRVKGTDSLSVSIPGTACAAYFLKGSRVMCECLGLAGGWGLDLAEVRRITGLLAVLGIDLFVPHGIYYSIAGHRKWESIPDHFHNPMWEFYREWADWISRISFLSSRGQRMSQVGLLYPSTAQRAHIEIGAAPAAGKEYKTSDRGPVCDLIDFTWVAAGNALLENNIAYEILDEKLLQTGRLAGPNLLVQAANKKDLALRVLILPCAKIIENKTAAVLERWRRAGGTVVVLNAGVEEIYDARRARLQPAAIYKGLHDFRMDFASERDFSDRYEQLLKLIRARTAQPVAIAGHGKKVVSRHWRKWGCEFYLLHNLSAGFIRDVQVELRGKYPPCKLDLEKAALRQVASQARSGAFAVKLDFSPAETILLVAGKSCRAAGRPERSRPEPAMTIALDGGWEFKPSGPNVLPLRAGVMEAIGAARRYTYRFRVKARPARAGLALDCEMKDMELRFDRLSNRIKCCLNGENIEAAYSGRVPPAGNSAAWAMKTLNSFHPGKHFDRWIFEADIARMLKKGINTLAVEVATGLLDENRNCGTPMLFGDFLVIGAGGKENIAPANGSKVEGDWRLFGYPYYSGMASYRRHVRLPSCRGAGKMILSLGKLANAAEVLADGRRLGRRILPPWEFDISGFIGRGRIDLEVRCINTPQNLWDARSLPSGLFGPVQIRVYA